MTETTRSGAAILAHIMRRMHALDPHSDAYRELSDVVEHFNYHGTYAKKDPLLAKAEALAFGATGGR